FRHGLEDFDLQRDQEELRAIQDARERIGEGTYGDCIDCGNAIPFERLKAQPSASRCVTCHSRYEQQQLAAPRYTTYSAGRWTSAAPWRARRAKQQRPRRAGRQYRMRQRIVSGTLHSSSSATWLASLSTSITT